MDNDNKNVSRNQRQLKAQWQLNNFINSPRSYEFDLNGNDLAILYIIARYLDMPDNICCLKQINLAKETRTSDPTIRRRCKYLVKTKILFRYLKGKLYYYELGEEVTGVQN